MAIASVAVVPETVPVPSVVVPSLKVTVPVGVIAPAMVEVSVVLPPCTVGFTLEATATVFTLRLTVCDMAAEVLAALLVSPPYTAVIECAPTIRFVTASVALAVTTVPVPRIVAPSMNVIVPVGALPPEIVAVKVVLPLYWVGLTLEVTATVVTF